MCNDSRWTKCLPEEFLPDIARSDPAHGILEVRNRAGWGSAPEAEIRAEEAERIIADALVSIEAEKRATYVEKGKVNGPTYAAYMSAIRAILHSEFVENDGSGRSYLDQLQAHLPDLSMEEYRDNHRCHLEYLAKLARERFLEKVRMELQGSKE